jgi:Protein kinase domain
MSGDAGQLVAGDYRLAESIGTGGMSVVWRARDEALGRDVAVKEIIFPVRIPEDERQRACARSVQDARAAAQLGHPGIITVHGGVEHDGRAWVVMDLFRGASLADLIDANGPLQPHRAAQIGLRALEALSAAHAAGIMHRDVKPTNVLVSGRRVVLTDFGAAAIHETPALTRSGTLTGTPAYLSPEQARRMPVGPESDLWSLGATLYAAVEGRPPYQGQDFPAVLSALLTSDPPLPRRAGPLSPILAGLMRRDASQRLTAAEAMGLLSAVAATAPGAPQTAQPTVAPRARPAQPGVPPGGRRPGGPNDGGGSRRGADGQPKRMPRRMVVPAVAGGILLLVALGATATIALASRHHNVAGSATPGTSSPLPVRSPVSAGPAYDPARHNCAAAPHTCGYPDASNTGVPPSVTLRSVPGQVSRGPGWRYSNGKVEVYGKGAVFGGYSVHGYVEVTGDNAVIKDDAISNFGNATTGDGVNLVGNPSNVTIEDINISSPHGTKGFMGVYAGIKDINGEAMGTKVLYNNIADASTGVQVYIGLIEGNYIHDVTGASPESHLNGTTSNGSTTPLTIEHNTVFNPNGQTDAISLFEDFGVEANVLITGNLVAGGGYTIYGGQNAGGPRAYNIRITDNRFSTMYYSRSGFFGYVTAFDPSAPGNVWSGNIWDTTGQPVQP